MTNSVPPRDFPGASSENRRSYRLFPWLITYSDLITLLLTFFILMMSMADLDPVRFDKASRSLQGAFGIPARGAAPEVIVPLPEMVLPRSGPSASSLLTLIDERLGSGFNRVGADENQVRTIKAAADTLVVRINEPVLFAAGKDDLRPEAERFLENIADAIADQPIQMRIEGHSDDLDHQHSGHADAWELSTARAISVLRFFVHQGRLGIDRLGAVGYGAERPVIDGSSEEHRALNRRVDIILQVKFPSGTTPANAQKRTIPL